MKMEPVDYNNPDLGNPVDVKIEPLPTEPTEFKFLVINYDCDEKKAALEAYDDAGHRHKINIYDPNKLIKKTIWSDFEKYAFNTNLKFGRILENSIADIMEDFRQWYNDYSEQNLQQQAPTKPLWKEASYPIQCTFKEAYDAIYGFALNHIYFEKDVYYHIFTCWIMATYYLKDWHAVPYMAFIAPFKSGKTRGLEIIEELAYRGFRTGNCSVSPIFRAIQEWHLTFCLDEAEALNPKTENGSALIRIFNDGYKKGGKTVRSERQGDTIMPTVFDVYSFKALASTRTFIPTLFSRCIVVHMQKKKPKNKHIDYAEADKIRSMMLYLESQPITVYNKDISEDGRLEELFIPIYTITENTSPDKKGLLDAYIKLIEAEDAEVDKESIEWKIMYSINAMLESAFANNFSKDIMQKELAKRILYYDEIDYNKKTIRDMSQKITYKLKPLGIKPEKQYNNINFIKFAENKKVLERLYERYLPNIVPPWLRLAPQQQQTSQQTLPPNTALASNIADPNLKLDQHDDLISDKV